MKTNSYNRGMPIIQRTKLVEPISDELADLGAKRIEANVIPINFRRRYPIVRNPAHVRATRLMTHTFFWDVA